MTWLADQIAAELDAMAATSEQLEKRISRLIRSCPPEIKSTLEATSLGTESAYAEDAKRVADAICPPEPIRGAA